MINQKLNIWNHLTDTTNNHDAFIEFEKRFCGTILEIFVKSIENPFKFYGIYKKNLMMPKTTHFYRYPKSLQYLSIWI